MNFTVKELSINCNAPKKKIVQGISFALNNGDKLSIIGESGCGKTMTALSLFNLLPENCYASGSAILGNVELIGNKQINKLRGRKLVYIPQNGAEFLNPIFSIKSQIYETLKIQGFPKETYKQKALDLLSDVGLEYGEQVLKKYPFEISGGMAQRVVLAIALAGNPNLIVADEPTKGIDKSGVDSFLSLLNKISKNKILVMITHDIYIAANSQKLLILFNGQVMEYGESDDILNNSSHPYTKELLNNLPNKQGFLDEKLIASPKSHSNKGCPYYERCPKSVDKCKNETPMLKEINKKLTRCFYA